ncbi:MAG: DUF370 domain-containing protein [Clostridia bacterium]|nr:DUF370 domain-containing protein [Clostridia bacterium]
MVKYIRGALVRTKNREKVGINIFIQLGKNKVVSAGDIIGIFDLDTTTIKRTTRDFLKNNERQKKVEVISDEIPRSFVICKKEKAPRSDMKVILSPLNAATLNKNKK